jgi:hypothetical protein
MMAGRMTWLPGTTVMPGRHGPGVDDGRVDGTVHGCGCGGSRGGGGVVPGAAVKV